MNCLYCDKDTFIKISEVQGVDLYSCHNEKCEQYAEVYVILENGLPIHYFELVNSLKNVINNG